MTLMRMPMFTWCALVSVLIIVAVFPIFTATLSMLLLDRYLGFHFFTNEAGGNVMMFMNLIWAWGHPEVYILVLPHSAFSPKWSRPFPPSRCSVTARWCWRPWRSA